MQNPPARALFAGEVGDDFMSRCWPLGGSQIEHNVLALAVLLVENRSSILGPLSRTAFRGAQLPGLSFV